MKRLVAIGIKRKGDDKFRLRTEVNLVSGNDKKGVMVPVTYSHDNDCHIINFGNIINNTPTR